MKKGLLFLITVMIICSSAICVHADEMKKLTVMVYMCGSNLETINGSASADIMEMMTAKFDDSKVSLLVMTGGAESWDLGFDPEETVIHEIGPRGRKTVLRSAKQNMGSRKTLTGFLQFCRDHYPAEEYALIIWDHGGGPLEGACWDELFSPDNLDLSEIVRGIENADFGKKFSWIGFDACLMSSLEAASALAPYADFMIASQETEPDYGWNYSFLSGIENDADGSVTGRRIVDAFFAGHEDSSDILTLACIDLEKASEAAAALDRFFLPIAEKVNTDNFAKLAGIRMSPTEFGKGIRALGDSGYDLVDAAGLITLMDDGSAGDLLDLLRESVVYSRSNEDGANGLSLYHPYLNKSKYAEKWRTTYGRLNFSEGYTRYLRAFGTLLTGSDPVDWNGLKIQSDGLDGENNALFHMQLTEEQAANFAYGQMLILLDSSEGKEKSFTLISTVPAYLDENGTVKAEFSGDVMYAEEESGFLNGPISILRAPGDGYRTVYAVYDELFLYDFWSERTKEKTSVAFFLGAEDNQRYPDILRKKVYDRITEQWSSRLKYSEDGYSYLYFYDLDRTMPAAGENEPLPAFADWIMDETLLSGYVLELPQEWKLLNTKIQTGDKLYAMFEITDVHQNTFATRPISFPYTNVIPFSAAASPTETDELRIELAGEVLMDEKALHFQVKVSNLTDEDQTVNYDSSSLMLNGSRRISNVRTLGPGMNSSYIHAGDSEFWNFYVDSNELIYLDTVSSFSFTVQRRTGHLQHEDIPAEFTLEGCDISGIIPSVDIIAEGKADGVLARLISFEAAETGFDVLLYIQNSGTADRYGKSAPLLNGIRSYDSSVFENLRLPAGTDGLLRLRIRNDFYLLSNVLPKDVSPVLSDHMQQKHGYDRIFELRLFFEKKRGSGFEDVTELRLRIEPPAVIPEDRGGGSGEQGLRKPDAENLLFPPFLQRSGEHELRKPDAKNPVYEIRVDRIAVSGNNLIAVLDITNKSDRWIRLIPSDGAINNGGTPCDVWVDYLQRDIKLAPDSVFAAGLLIEVGEDMTEETIRDFSVRFQGEDGVPDELIKVSFDPIMLRER